MICVCGCLSVFVCYFYFYFLFFYLFLLLFIFCTFVYFNFYFCSIKKLFFVQCLYEAGKYSRIRLLDLYCEVLNPDLYPSRSSDSHVGNENDHSLSSSNDSSQQYSIIQKGGSISQIVRIVR